MGGDVYPGGMPLPGLNPWANFSLSWLSQLRARQDN